MEQPKNDGGKAVSNSVQFCRKGVYSFRRFNYIRELIPNCWRSPRESTFANIQVNFMSKMLVRNG